MPKSVTVIVLITLEDGELLDSFAVIAPDDGGVTPVSLSDALRATIEQQFQTEESK